MPASVRIQALAQRAGRCAGPRPRPPRGARPSSRAPSGRARPAPRADRRRAGREVHGQRAVAARERVIEDARRVPVVERDEPADARAPARGGDAAARRPGAISPFWPGSSSTPKLCEVPPQRLGGAGTPPRRIGRPRSPRAAPAAPRPSPSTRTTGQRVVELVREDPAGDRAPSSSSTFARMRGSGLEPSRREGRTPGRRRLDGRQAQALVERRVDCPPASRRSPPETARRPRRPRRSRPVPRARRRRSRRGGRACPRRPERRGAR